MRRAAACLLASCAIAAGAVRPAEAQIDAGSVQQAIDRGVDYLEREQLPGGNWPEWDRQFDGAVTSLCTLALVNCGVAPQDPMIRKAVQYLRNVEADHTYAVALQTMALCAAEPKRDLAKIRRNVRWLERSQTDFGPQAGAWGYPSGAGDGSNAQFALLALHEAERVGVPVNARTWRRALDYWQRIQRPDGSWGYQSGHPGTGSMTAAGVSSVVIAADKLYDPDATIENGKVRCCASVERDSEVDRALIWLARHFSTRTNPPGGPANVLYYLYALERAGRLTAQRFVGSHDWYREGAETVVSMQDQLSGYWKGTSRGENNPHVGTCFALLFLSKGRRPVLAAKLRYGNGEDWNNHRSDLANLTRYVELKWQRDLTWQVVDSRLATLDDLSLAPVLYISGRRNFNLSPNEIANLRAYVDAGGFIFAEACCGGEEFDAAFESLMKQVFPEPGYGLEPLPPDHPIWRAEEPVDPEYVRPLWGINAGCRTSVVYCPADLSCYWELGRPGRDQELPADVRLQIAAANSIGINVLAYATNRQLSFKDDVMPVAEEDRSRIERVERARLDIARLRHNGGWNEAPAAVVNLQKAISRELGIRTSVDRNELNISDEKLFNYHLVFMDGRRSFQLSEAERNQLRTFIERGGMLLANAVCGSEEFATAFRREMATLFPDQPLVPVPDAHPLLTDEYGGFDVRQVTRRDPARGGADGRLESTLREVAPELEGIEIDGRFVVLFSPYDLSCALEKQESLACQGYTREDAARIAINLVLYSLQ